jgi:aryl-alcohol dehydrogenase-like predicted oxidoreductase
MKYTLLGNTGLRVSPIAFGAMTFGTGSGFGADEPTCRAMFDAYADRGGNFIDTANSYTDGDSERMVGAFLQGRRGRFVLASKYSVSSDRTDPNGGGNGRKALVQALEASLSRLGTDYLDLYWVHVWDGVTPVEEAARALEDVVRQGKVLHVGFSDHPAWLVARADALAEGAGWVRPAAIQVEYSLAQRDAERELLPMAEWLGMGVLAWAPLAGGALTGKYLQDGGEGRVGSAASGHYVKYRDERTARIARTVVEAARGIGCTPGQLAVAWIRGRPPLCVPLIGARTVNQLVHTPNATEVEIPPDVIARLDEVSAVRLGFPHDFLRENWRRWFGAGHEGLDPRIRPVGRRLMGMPPRG